MSQTNTNRIIPYLDPDIYIYKKPTFDKSLFAKISKYLLIIIIGCFVLYDFHTAPARNWKPLLIFIFLVSVYFASDRLSHNI